jgi:hypothetical protein
MKMHLYSDELLANKDQTVNGHATNVPTACSKSLRNCVCV